MVCGYHCYSTIGEEFPCKLELSNPEDRVCCGSVSVWDHFCWRKKMIACQVTGVGGYSTDLLQGVWRFSANSAGILKGTVKMTIRLKVFFTMQWKNACWYSNILIIISIRPPNYCYVSWINYLLRLTQQSVIN